MKTSAPSKRSSIRTLAEIIERPRKIGVLTTSGDDSSQGQMIRLFFLFFFDAKERNAWIAAKKNAGTEGQQVEGISAPMLTPLTIPDDMIDEFVQVIQYSDFRGQLSESIQLPNSKAIVLGLGAKSKWSLENICIAIMSAGGIFRQLRSCVLQIPLDIQSLFLNLHQGKAEQEGLNRLEQKPDPISDLGQTISDSSVEGAASSYGETFGNIIAQMIVSLELVFDDMAFLKTHRQSEASDAPVDKRHDKRDKEEMATQTMKEEKFVDDAQPLAVRFQVPVPFEKSLDTWLSRANDLSSQIRNSRSIAAMPGNILHPQAYQSYAEKLAKKYKLKIQVLQVEELQKIGMNGVLTVGQGSVNPPRVIVLQYQPAKPSTEKPLVLVGKGITFDTGGISLKPSQKMHEMKYDMCGSSLALHAIALAAKRELSLPVYTILGLAENMPDGNAIKPGDVYQAYNGLTVENQNTDAEGRLVLGDILAYAVEQNPEMLCMVDFATLTGACIVALGHEAGGLMTSSEDMAHLLSQSSQRSLDRLWRLPHWSIYDRGLKSEVSDIRNITDKGAGTVTAMRFLAKFVPAHVHWAHLDIAGVAWLGERIGGQPSGPTGWGLRLMLDFMETLSEQRKKTLS